MNAVSGSERRSENAMLISYWGIFRVDLAAQIGSEVMKFNTGLMCNDSVSEEQLL